MRGVTLAPLWVIITTSYLGAIATQTAAAREVARRDDRLVCALRKSFRGGVNRPMNSS